MSFKTEKVTHGWYKTTVEAHGKKAVFFDESRDVCIDDGQHYLHRLVGQIYQDHKKNYNVNCQFSRAFERSEA